MTRSAPHGDRSPDRPRPRPSRGTFPYKYFSDIEAILAAWHERQIAGHLEDLAAVRDRAEDAYERLQAVLEAFALIVCEHRHHAPELVALLHRGEHVSRVQQGLRDLLTDLLAEGVEAGVFRGDVAPSELASYCLHALAAAGSLPSEAAARRLATVVLTGLHPRK